MAIARERERGREEGRQKNKCLPKVFGFSKNPSSKIKQLYNKNKNKHDNNNSNDNVTMMIKGTTDVYIFPITSKANGWKTRTFLNRPESSEWLDRRSCESLQSFEALALGPKVAKLHLPTNSCCLKIDL